MPSLLEDDIYGNSTWTAPFFDQWISKAVSRPSNNVQATGIFGLPTVFPRLNNVRDTFG